MNALVLVLLVAAAPPDIQAKIELGAGGFASPKGMTYAIVQIQNAGRQAECEVQATVSDLRTAHYVRHVSMPRGSRKRVFVYVHSSANFLDCKVTVRVRGEAKPFARAAFVRAAPVGARGICVVGKRVGIRRYLQTTPLARWQARILPPEQTPGLWAGYTMFEAVVLSDCDLNKMSLAQQSALDQWVRAGGTLVLTGGPTAARYTNALLGDLCPVRFAQTQHVADGGAIARWCKAKACAFDKLLCATGPLRFGQVQLRAGGIPLVATHRAALGRVHFLAFDPGAKVFRSWPGRMRFWGKLLNVDFTKAAAEDAGFVAQAVLGQHLASGGHLSPVLIVGSTIFLIIYAALVGPVTYRCVQRTRRYALWPAFMLGLAAAFGLIALAMRPLLRSGQDAIKTATLVDVPQDMSMLLARQYGTLYRASRQAWSLTLPAAGAVAHAVELGAQGYGRVGAMTFAPGRRELAMSAATNVWPHYGWTARWQTALPAHTLRGAIAALGGRLEDSYVLTAKRLHWVGDLDAEELRLPIRERLSPGLASGARLDWKVVCESERPMVYWRQEKLRVTLLKLSFAREIMTDRWRWAYAQYKQKVDRSELSARPRLNAGRTFLFGWATHATFLPRMKGHAGQSMHEVLARIELPPGSFEAALEEP